MAGEHEGKGGVEVIDIRKVRKVPDTYDCETVMEIRGRDGRWWVAGIVKDRTGTFERGMPLDPVRPDRRWDIVWVLPTGRDEAWAELVSRDSGEKLARAKRNGKVEILTAKLPIPIDGFQALLKATGWSHTT